MVLSILWTPQKHALGCHKNIHSKRRSLTNFCRRMQVTQKLKSLVKKRLFVPCYLGDLCNLCYLQGTILTGMNLAVFF